MIEWQRKQSRDETWLDTTTGQFRIVRPNWPQGGGFQLMQGRYRRVIRKGQEVKEWRGAVIGTYASRAEAEAWAEEFRVAAA